MKCFRSKEFESALCVLIVAECFRPYSKLRTHALLSICFVFALFLCENYYYNF